MNIQTKHIMVDGEKVRIGEFASIFPQVMC